MLGRFFGRQTGGNWRPPADELRFAAAAGFDTVQIRSDRPGELEDELGVPAGELGELYDELGVEPVLELLVRHTGERGTFARALRASLAANTNAREKPTRARKQRKSPRHRRAA